MEYINNIYDYKTTEVRAYSGLETHRAIIGQGLRLKVTKYPDQPWLTTAQFERSEPGTSHSVKINAIAEHHSTLELHIFTDTYSEDSINYDIYLTAEQDSDVTLSVVSIKGKKVSVNITVNITGKNATVKLPGLLLPSKDESFTYHSTVIHQEGGSTTTQKVRTVANENGYGDFFGIIKVQPDAQKSVTEQVNNNILLSENARIESMPQLEIYADDVKCSHGSTTGMLDQDAIFYMRSRGISEKTAQNLLLQAFLDEIADNISTEKEYVDLVKESIADKFGMEQTS